MKKNYILSILFLLLIVGASANSADVKNISFSYQPGYTVSSIDVDGTIRFTHQTEIAKNGKPFRVIVDVLSAEHKIGAKTFLSLPNCAVKGLRTSQFSISPEKVVRLVFDMSSESMYKIETEKNQIKVLFPDNKSQSFANWSTNEFLAQQESDKATPSNSVATKTVAKKPTNKSASTKVASINSNIESDRQESLQGNSSNISKKVSAPVIVKKPEVVMNSKDHIGPVMDKSDLSPSSLSSSSTVSDKKESISTSSNKAKEEEKPVVIAKAQPKTEAKITPKAIPMSESTAKEEKKPIVVAKAQPKTEAKTTPYVSPKAAPKSTPKAKVENKPVVVAKTQPKEEVKSTPKTKESSPSSSSIKASSSTKTEKKNAPKKTTLANNNANSSKDSKKSNTTASKKSSSNSKTTVASKSKNEKSAKKSTSRFRRSSANDNKIKGTMVAEFPKRLVIKYKNKSRKDPFETLVNESKVNNSLINKRLPNVEGLSLVGVIESDSGKNRALFEDKNGYGYILKAGDKVQKGYVLRVKNDRVYFQIFEYGWSRTVALNLE